jgi:glycerol-3-phosphate dehydrogenase
MAARVVARICAEAVAKARSNYEKPSRRAACDSDQTFGVCVLGATGLGSALDAQQRGLSTVLVDAADFVSQTSSASTKLIHGGVRYLERTVLNLDSEPFRMVRGGMKERIHILHAAPYLARQIKLLAPCYSRWQMLYLAAGLKIYDLIAPDRGRLVRPFRTDCTPSAAG